MKKNNLQNKLFESGLIEKGNPAKINEFKKAYRSDYAKDYNHEFNVKNKRKTLIFTPEEFEYLEEQATKYKMKVSPFLKALIFAYLNATFIYPEKETLLEIEKLLREINRRVTESIQYIHLSENITVNDIQSIKMDISALDKYISNALKNPPRIEIWLKNQIAKDDLFLPKLLQEIAKFLTV